MRPSSRRGLALVRKRLDLYGIDNRGDAWGLFVFGVLTAAAVLVLIYTFSVVVSQINYFLPWLSVGVIGFLVGFATCLSGLLAVAYWITLFSLLYTSLILRFLMAERIVSSIDDWSHVNRVLDVGCGKGQLLNTVACKLKKEGGGGRAVGVDIWLSPGAKNSTAMAIPLRAAAKEGLGTLVTCKSGSATDLPFTDGYFDVVVSALYLHTIDQENAAGSDGESGARLRRRALSEMIRVAKSGAPIVIWDIVHAQDYAIYLKEIGMENVSISESGNAFMLPSHIIVANVPRRDRK